MAPRGFYMLKKYLQGYWTVLSCLILIVNSLSGSGQCLQSMEEYPDLSSTLYCLRDSAVLSHSIVSSAINKRIYPARGIFKEAAFYVVAHPDDWILFMGNHAWDDIRSFYEDNEHHPNPMPEYPNGKQVIIINITSGVTRILREKKQDNNCRSGYQNISEENKSKYWYAWQMMESAELDALTLVANREENSDQKLKINDGWGETIAQLPSYSVTRVMTRGQESTTVEHDIATVRFKNVVVYFLRIDAATMYKNGHVGNGIDFLTDYLTADHKSYYKGFKDVCNTIASIFRYETLDNPYLTRSQPRFDLNTFETDQYLNPGDQAGHFFVAELAIKAQNITRDCGLNREMILHQFLGSSLLSRNNNLKVDDTSQQTEHKSELYGAYLAGLLADDDGFFDNSSSFCVKHPIGFLSKEYLNADMPGSFDQHGDGRAILDSIPTKKAGHDR